MPSQPIPSTDLRYPIGRAEMKPFRIDGEIDRQTLSERLLDIKMLPGLLENAVLNLDEAQLNTCYRDGGWTVKQVVHHVADSHMNAFTRFKLGLTEDHPTIKPYNEDAWVKLPDTTDVPINVSVTILHALHIRWLELLSNVSDEQWERTIFHPEMQQTLSLWDLLSIYSWHGKHHAAHITSLRERMKW
jgi:uncharacterized damage-inducible protein DinB